MLKLLESYGSGSAVSDSGLRIFYFWFMVYGLRFGVYS